MMVSTSQALPGLKSLRIEYCVAEIWLNYYKCNEGICQTRSSMLYRQVSIKYQVPRERWGHEPRVARHAIYASPYGNSRHFVKCRAKFHFAYANCPIRDAKTAKFALHLLVTHQRYVAAPTKLSRRSFTAWVLSVVTPLRERHE